RGGFNRLMKQFAIIGLDFFGLRALEELIPFGIDILIIDKNEELIQSYKDKVSNAYVIDVTKIDALKKVLPKTIDVAIVDLGGNVEASILMINYLKELGIRQIVIKAETDQRGKIFELLGATMVVFPHREALKRIIPMLLSPLLMNYFPISEDLIIAEVKVPLKFSGKSLIQVDLRKNHRMNVIAIKDQETNKYQNFSPHYEFKDEDVILVSGSEKDISNFIQHPIKPKSKGLMNFIKGFFQPKKQKK
ncbi:MAG: TrkA family potassium uptake protein, partial [Spirochaetales bacterium]|nr:TrkA family potassium uptake protein [Spirochaetales bacterium]